MNNRYSLKKSNRRYKGGHLYGYIVLGNRFSLDQYDFCEIREWCWITFGPSKELENIIDDNLNSYDKIIHHNKQWCWQYDEFNKRIYLYSDIEASLFTLRFM